MTEISPPLPPARWQRGSPSEWALVAVLGTSMGLLYWYDLPLHMSIVGGLMAGSAPAMALWRQQAGLEPRRHQGWLWMGLAGSIVGTAIFLVLLIQA